MEREAPLGVAESDGLELRSCGVLAGPAGVRRFGCRFDVDCNGFSFSDEPADVERRRVGEQLGGSRPQLPLDEAGEAVEVDGERPPLERVMETPRTSGAKMRSATYVPTFLSNVALFAEPLDG